jgi:NodT family efflux transporter outer membrane factor (OMF) lipoprotein
MVNGLSQKDIAWWTIFEDDNLNQLIEEALQQNFDVQISLEKIRQARAVVGLSTASLFPDISAFTSYTHRHLSQNEGGQSAGETVTGSTTRNTSSSPELFNAAFDASWEIDVFGGLRRAREASLATLEAVIEDGRAILISQMAEIAQVYLTLRNNQQQVRNLKAQVDLWETYLRLTKSLFRSGLTNDIDVSTADFSLAQTRAQIPLLQQDIKTQLHQLALLVGQEPNYLYERLSAPKDLHIPNSSTLVASGLPVCLIEQRPDIREAERNLAAATAEVGVSIAALFPDVRLIGNYGYESRKGSNLFTPKSIAWSYTPSISLHILDFGRLKAQIDENKSLRQQAFLTYKKIIFSALGDVETALVRFREEDIRSQNLQKAYQAMKQVESLTESLYKAGLNQLLDVYQAKINALVAQQTYLNSELARGLNLISLYKALGGGWDAVPTFKRQDYPPNIVASSAVSEIVNDVLGEGR